MRIRNLPVAAVGVALAFSLMPASAAAPDDGPTIRTPDQRASGTAEPPVDARLAVEPTDDLPGQPSNDVIEDVPVDPDDASIPLNLTPYHDIPPALRALQDSERISVEIIGQSTQGRDLHLVVATSPMGDDEWSEWQRLSDLRTDDPQAAIAAFESGEYDDWKTPLLVNNNIHGNEWEGTDASLQVLDRLAFSDDDEVEDLLDEHVIAFVVTNNPDGRVAGTRQNANGFDVNRDYITGSQPESRAVRDQIVRYNPLTMLDEHGYTGTTLIEPTTGPHGQNYEYDLYIGNALRNALAMEEAVLGLDEPRVDAVNIPYRNQESGWDDWPPIFTPMYSMHHGVVGHTVEFPLDPRGLDDVDERHERTRINTAVSRASIEANFDWAHENRQSLLADQLEMFRRGAAGEESRPVDDELALSLAAGDNAKTFNQEYPRAYVIPGGAGHRGDPASARLAQFLIDNDVAVHQARRPFTAGDERYPAGSYVVDMHQAKRGLANTILDVGRDVTTDFPTMYDISAWSHGLLWGANVQRVTGDSLETRALDEVNEAASTAWVAPGDPAYYSFESSSAAGLTAANQLLDAGVELSRLNDGTLAVPGSAREDVIDVAESFGVAFTALDESDVNETEPLPDVRLGTAATDDEMYVLTATGFDPTAVTHTDFNDGTHTFDDFDALYVATSAFDPEGLDETRSAAFSDWLADGGTIVGRGSSGIEFNETAGLLDVTAQAAREDANGIVSVENNPDSAVTGDALPSSFVSSPHYFSDIGDGVDVDQWLSDGDFFLAGHWVGQEDASGAPVVVTGEARGADVTLFGTEPLYRAHTEGLFEQVADALWR